MKNIDQRVARSMVRIGASQEWQPIREWLEASLADVDRQLRRAQPDHVPALQGEAKAIETLLEKFDNAREIDEKLSRRGVNLP